MEHLPRELAQCILPRVPLSDLIELLAASRRIRSLFWISDDDYVDAKNHLLLQLPSLATTVLYDDMHKLCTSIPFKRLPMAYALGMFALKGPVEEVVTAIFPAISPAMYYGGVSSPPHQLRPLRIERLLRKALELRLVDMEDEWHWFAFDVAAAIGSVEITEQLISMAIPDPPSSEWSEERVKVSAAALRAACRQGPVALVKHLLLNSPVNLRNVCDIFGPDRSSINYAAIRGDLDILEALFAPMNGVAPEIAMSGPGMPSPIGDAADTATALWLLAHASDVRDATNWRARGRDLLHNAVMDDNKILTAAFIERGVSPDAMDVYFRSPLHTTVRCNKPEIAKVLLAHGARLDRRDRWGATPMDFAIAKDNRELFDLFLRSGTDASDGGRDGISSPLHTAIALGRLEMVKVLHPLDPKTVQHSVDCCESICSHARFNPPDGLTPLMYAAYHRHLDVIRWLLVEGGCDKTINAVDCMGHTALHYAAGALEFRGLPLRIDEILIENEPSRADHVDVVRLLLQHGADRFVKRRRWKLENDEVLVEGPYLDVKELCRHAAVKAVLEEWDASAKSHS
ncbi:hypothetical protein HDU96_007687 [Phlyctochytrium bullatum]|nr:hypothetical protein HDU96_007687 [Phlyctochytrium bullatum]